MVLDSGPLSLAASRRGKSADVDACKRWIAQQPRAGRRVYVPEIADYEVRRELLRARKTASIARLDIVKRDAYYLPITTEIMLKAAALWADVRLRGLSTADPHALDGDAILAATVLSLGLAREEVIVATTNVGHLTRFVEADLWSNIV
ncbi:MAG TPA: PIN domain-containing protein [Chthonomonadaceae bacterium]|nr:PIN domain-containing protein [Chthonomonadaceae bacterium]